MKYLKTACTLLLSAFFVLSLQGQTNDRTIPEKCGTMQNLELLFQKNPAFKARFEAERDRFNKSIRPNTLRQAGALNGNKTFVTIPVVFHVVINDQSQVSDASILAQLDTINRDYAGINGDTVRVPTYFKSVFGQSSIQFCLAKQTPEGDPTTGIERTSTSAASFSNTDNGVKHASSGGADAWDPSSYLNIWICPLSGGLLGYGTFPATGNDNEQGVVIEYRSLPASPDNNYAVYKGGKTLTHEIGHYFNLYHIWGDDDGACTGTDYIDDTPNQANSSSTCRSGVVTDACSPSSPGIMYQNYMDYTADDCLVMFTAQQVARMESALTTYRSSLLSSTGCQTPVVYSVDARLKTITSPVQRLCSNPFRPAILIVNRGTQTLTSVTITTSIDNVVVSTEVWTGSLAQQASVTDSLKAVTTPDGSHTLKITLSNPNNTADQNPSNDSQTITFQYNAPVSSVTESFEGSVFPPAGWDVLNPDNSITWQKTNAAAKTGGSSVMIDNFDYSVVGARDYLRLPDVNLPGTLDSAFLSFQVAAATYTATSTANNPWDTLEVMVSRDCGATYTSLYKKWGATLVTHAAPLTTAFVPAASEWRKDSINITNLINTGTILLAFRNTSGFENNIYLDDINLRTVVVNPNLKQQKFLVTPSPTSGLIAVQFYPQPTNVKAIQVFSMNGQKVAEIIPNGQSNFYQLDISRYSTGIYLVRAIMGNDVLVKKVFKY